MGDLILRELRLRPYGGMPASAAAAVHLPRTADDLQSASARAPARNALASPGAPRQRESDLERDAGL